MAVRRGQLKALIRDLGAIPDDVRKEMRPAIRDGAEDMVAEMRRRTSWSTRIPRAIRVSTRFSKSAAGASINVSSARAPHARPYENDGMPGFFRHPVFGNREVWVPQEARPFFYSTVRDKADSVRDRVGDAIDTVLARHGFH